MRITDALPRLFENSLKNALNDVNADISWQVSNFERPKEAITKEAIFLTISNHNFRIFVSLHFNLEECKQFVMQSLKLKSNDVDEQTVYDFLMEVGNSICGVFKRELGKSVPALGMSTPNLLQEGCFNYMDVFDVQCECHRQVLYDKKMLLFTSVYYTHRENYEVDINMTLQNENVETGELEMF